MVSILYKYHISLMHATQLIQEKDGVSILYKYHISPGNVWIVFGMWLNWCRSFISIIFPQRIQCQILIMISYQCRSFIRLIFPRWKHPCYYALAWSVSILYKYHISLFIVPFIHYFHLAWVSILYKYHISLTKYSTFWTLIAENVEKRSILAYIFRPPPVFRLFLVFKLTQI